MSYTVDRRTTCPVTKYARSVVSGKIVAGKWVRLACQRHLDDLKTAKSRGLVFDRAASERAIFFCETLRHTKGEWGGLQLKLSPFQKFIVGSIFGWKWKATGLRRFRKAYNEVARKNGKSTFSGPIALYMLTADGEPGAEVYTAATKREQAGIVFGEAMNMLRALPAEYMLRKIVSIYKHSIVVDKTASKMMALSSDAKTLDGLNPHCSIVDELHAHESRALWDILDTAMGARRQPLQFAITTAGYDRHSVCWQEREYSTRVLEGIVEDDSLFAYIATIDEGDNPFDENVWVKANPNLGTSIKKEYLRDQAKRAKEVTSFYNEFLRLHLNVWTESETRWLPLEKWDVCNAPVALDSLKNRPCFAGLDLSSTTDLSSYVKVWPPYEDDQSWRVHARFWIPEENMRERIRRDRVPYDVWARQGWIEPTPGDVIDHDFIQAAIERDNEEYEIIDNGFDPFNATMIMSRLTASGVNMVAFRQGFISMSPAVKQTETLILGRKLAHGGNPVLRWMMTNVVMEMDPAGNIKPAKNKSNARIDGLVAMFIAIGRATATADDGPSVYETRGII